MRTLKVGDPLFYCKLFYDGKVGEGGNFSYNCEQVGIVTKITEENIHLRGMGRFENRNPSIRIEALNIPAIDSSRSISTGMSFYHYVPSKETGALLCRKALAEIRERVRLNAEEQQRLLERAMLPVAGLETESDR